MLKQPTSDAYDDLVSKIVAVTGWPKELAEVEVDVGFSVTIAAGLTFSEAADRAPEVSLHRPPAIAQSSSGASQQGDDDFIANQFGGRNQHSYVLWVQGVENA